MSTLVIVESPTKARTIRNYLPSDYRVEASMGHVRDLPQSASDIPASVKEEKWAQLGVNVEANFEPIYVIPQDKKKIVQQLKDALKDATELVLATDEDREGESISWHLLQVLKPKVPTKRMVFHEITQEAIKKALKNCRNIDEQLVHAQETRRILDRLVGYTLSPLLWKKIAWGLSAGRVQSVSVRLLVNRERQRRAFRQGSYWDLKAILEQGKAPFDSRLVTVGGVKVATGADFDANTGQIIAGRQVRLLSEAEARELRERLLDKTWTVADLEERPVTRKPSAPFTTSTLQQEANRKLRLSARDTMRTAQSLYEQGYITYMRTDSVHLSEQAIAAARSCVEQMYGQKYLSPKPRQYATKSKGAQEDQEVILPPLKVGDHPNCRELEADGHETQPPARYTEASLVKTLESEGIGRPSTYASIIDTIQDKGYAQMNGNALVPTFTAFAVTGLLEKYFPNLVDTSFTSKMEQTLDEISSGEADWRPYLRNFYLVLKGLETQVKEQESQIDPNEARTVELENLAAKVRIGKFGAYIEAENGNGVVTASIPKDVTPAELDPEQVEVLLRQKTEGPDKLGRHPEKGDPIYVLRGPYGPYVRLGDVSEENKKPKQASLPKGVTIENVTLDMAVGLLALPRTLGVHPATGGKIQASLGRFGPYVVHDQGKEGKDYRSLKAADNVLTITLERTLELLSEPKKGRAGGSKAKKALRELGAHPGDNEPVSIYDGPYGPYIKHGKTNVSLPEGQSVEDMTMETALELLAAKESTKKSSSKSSKSTSSTRSKSTGTSSSSKTTKKKTTTSTSTKKNSSKSAS